MLLCHRSIKLRPKLWEPPPYSLRWGQEGNTVKQIRLSSLQHKTHTSTSTQTAFAPKYFLALSCPQEDTHTSSLCMLEMQKKKKRKRPKRFDTWGCRMTPLNRLLPHRNAFTALQCAPRQWQAWEQGEWYEREAGEVRQHSSGNNEQSQQSENPKGCIQEENKNINKHSMWRYSLWLSVCVCVVNTALWGPSRVRTFWPVLTTLTPNFRLEG